MDKVETDAQILLRFFASGKSIKTFCEGETFKRAAFNRKIRKVARMLTASTRINWRNYVAPCKYDDVVEPWPSSALSQRSGWLKMLTDFEASIIVSSADPLKDERKVSDLTVAEFMSILQSIDRR